MGFQKPIMAPVSRAGKAKFASKFAGMHPASNSMPGVGKGASATGKSMTPVPGLTKKLNMKAKSPVYKAHAPAKNPGGIFNNDTGKPSIGNPNNPRKLVSGSMKGSAFFGQ